MAAIKDNKYRQECGESASLVGMQNGAATVENSMVALQKYESRISV